MTKDQKVAQVESVVQEARRWYTLQEFSNMFLAIWNGLEAAKNAAQEGAANGNPVP